MHPAISLLSGWVSESLCCLLFILEIAFHVTCTIEAYLTSWIRIGVKILHLWNISQSELYVLEWTTYMTNFWVIWECGQ
jgi:hypothetical protein